MYDMKGHIIEIHAELLKFIKTYKREKDLMKQIQWTFMEVDSDLFNLGLIDSI